VNTANIGMFNTAGITPQPGLMQDGENADVSFAEMLLGIIKTPVPVRAAEPEPPAITYPYRESEETESLIKLLELIGVPIEAARRITAEYVPEKNYGGPNYKVETIDDYVPQEPDREWVSEDIERIVSEIMRPAKTENIDFTQISRSAVFKGAVLEYAAELVSPHGDSIEPAEKERAELITKAVKAIEGEVKIEKLTAAKTDGTRQIIQNAAYAAPVKISKISIEDMANVMRKAPVTEFTEPGMREVPKAAPAAAPETANIPEVILKRPAPVVAAAEAPEEPKPKPDFGPEIRAPEMTAAKETGQFGPAIADMAESAGELAQIIAGKLKNNAKIPAGEFEVKMKLSPKELGELTVKVSYSKGSVTLDITAASKTAESGILTRVAELRESLAVRGISLADVSVGVDTGERQRRQNDAPREGYNKNSRKIKDSVGGTGSLTAAETTRSETLKSYMKSTRLLYRTI